MILAAICVLFGVLFFGTFVLLAQRHDPYPPHDNGCDCGECRERLIERRIGKDGW